MQIKKRKHKIYLKRPNTLQLIRTLIDRGEGRFSDLTPCFTDLLYTKRDGLIVVKQKKFQKSKVQYTNTI